MRDEILAYRTETSQVITVMALVKNHSSKQILEELVVTLGTLAR